MFSTFVGLCCWRYAVPWLVDQNIRSCFVARWRSDKNANWKAPSGLNWINSRGLGGRKNRSLKSFWHLPEKQSFFLEGEGITTREEVLFSKTYKFTREKIDPDIRRRLVELQPIILCPPSVNNINNRRGAEEGEGTGDEWRFGETFILDVRSRRTVDWDRFTWHATAAG